MGVAGFEVSSTGTVLTWPDDGKYPGLEVRCDELSMGALLDLMEDVAALNAAQQAPDGPPFLLPPQQPAPDPGPPPVKKIVLPDSTTSRSYEERNQ